MSKIGFVSWYSDFLMQLGENKRALLFSKKYLYGNYRKAYYLLNANNHLQNEEEWLKNLNMYLNRIDTAPISLNNHTNDKIFFKICCKLNYEIKQGPLVTIIMPVYNAEKTISFAIDSILNQTYKNIELIIVDDYSNDSTLEFIKQKQKIDARIKIICNKQNLGPYISKNKALDISDGEYITGHDADDWAHPQRIEKQVDFMLNNPKIKAMVAKKIRITEEGKIVNFYISKKAEDDGILSTAFISCIIDATFMKSKLGYWDSVRFGADSEIMNRIKSLDESIYVEENIFTMFCLESKTSLTNHPKHGISKITGMSDIRRKYFDSFKNWHKETSDYYINFPLLKRPFEAPVEMQVEINNKGIV
ncbi:glycosyltransferase family 2 protein [Campylobacter coli]|nr:glycosyltransferase family 2 protein [Campylobacter coli]